MKMSEMKIVKVDIDWHYNHITKKYDFIDKHGILCADTIGKTCSILKDYYNINHYRNDKWGYLENVLFSILDDTPENFDGSLMTKCYLIKIESVL